MQYFAAAQVIHYDLVCGEGHAFDGWFRDSAAFDQQAQRGQLSCPGCGATSIRRALMAPRLSRNAKAPARAMPAETPGGGGATAPPQPVGGVGASVSPHLAPPTPRAPGERAMPDEMRAVLQKVRAEVERRCDYVGPAFAQEARRIHAGKVPERPIYGETTPEQAEALQEDGIAVARIPWLPRADS